ncbi:MAG: hypothetical protein O9284_15985 [Steroidobacteraceae bacterium]|jgi:hypothetical protein|nr:hypothetical protein [Steroidobacteraceae bacterium]
MDRNVGVGMIVVPLAIATALGIWIVRMITDGMRRAVRVFGKIQAGDFCYHIVVKTNDPAR